MNRAVLLKDYLLFGLVSFSLLVFQFLLSKELIFLYGPNISYWVIPLVMLGFSLGSAMSRIKFLGKISQENLIFLYILAMFIPLYCLVKFPGIIASPSPSLLPALFNNILKLLVLFVSPFVILGLYFGRVYSEFKNLSLVFMSNGIGLALGAISLGKIYKFFGWPGGIFFITFLLLAFLIYFNAKRTVFYLFTIIIFIFIYKFGLLKSELLDRLDFQSHHKNAKIVITKYSELIRTDVLELDNKRYAIFTDGGAPTRIIRIPKAQELYQAQKEDYQEVQFSFGDHQRVLIIGSGGGSQVYQALKAGSKSIKAVEFNPVIIQLMKNEFKEYSGSIYSHPNVEVINKEGRDYVTHTKEKFDLILLVNADTLTLFSSLTPFVFESYLYTREALNRYLDILSPEGYVIIEFSAVVPIWKAYRALQMLQVYKTVESLDLSEHAIIMYRKAPDGNNKDFNQHILVIFKQRVSEDFISKFKVKNELLYSLERISKINYGENDHSGRFNMNILRDDRPSFGSFVEGHGKTSFILKLFFIICLPIIILLILRKTTVRKTIFYLLLGTGYIALELNLMGKLVLLLGNPVYPMQIVLASFLFFGGCGGYWAIKHKVEIKTHVFLLAPLTFLLIFVCNWLYTLNISSNFLKNIFVLFISAPIGFFSAIPFSKALSLEEEKHIIYALDGIGTVLGAISIVFIQTSWGFSAGFIFISLIYLLAFLNKVGLA